MPRSTSALADIGDEYKSIDKRCAICAQYLAHRPYVVCEVCDSLHVCLSCFGKGRQGVFNGHRHEYTHAYRVVAPGFAPHKVKGAAAELEAMCARYSFARPKFTLLAVARGPLPVSERRCPMTQYRMGVELTPINASGQPSLRRFFIAGSQHAPTLLEARDYAAVEAFYVVFGAHHAFPMTLFEKKVTRGRKPPQCASLISIVGLYSHD